MNVVSDWQCLVEIASLSNEDTTGNGQQHPAG